MSENQREMICIYRPAGTQGDLSGNELEYRSERRVAPPKGFQARADKNNQTPRLDDIRNSFVGREEALEVFRGLFTGGVMAMPRGLDEMERGREAAEVDRVNRDDLKDLYVAPKPAEVERAHELSPALAEAEGTRLQKGARAQERLQEPAPVEQEKLSPARSEFVRAVEALRRAIVGQQLRPAVTAGFHADLDALLKLGPK